MYRRRNLKPGLLLHFALRGGLQFLVAVAIAMSGLAVGQTSETDSKTPEKVSSKEIGEVVIAAFSETHKGYSSDEVLLQDELNRAFVNACKKRLPKVDESRLNWSLLNLRKAGKLKDVKTTKRANVDTSGVTYIAEIVARSLQDKHRVSSDKIMADPKLRAEFGTAVAELDPKADLYLVRKAAFQLRKTRRLKPELITRIADWGRKVGAYPLDEVRGDLTKIPELPGIYIFRDTTGYLYIGQSVDLRERLTSHLDDSSNKGLGKYLSKAGGKKLSIEIHYFPADSRAAEVRVRRAYESELIRSRKPRFNISP